MLPNGAFIVTNNKAFGEWGEVFGSDAVVASAALDRLLHRATVVNTQGESYRLKEKRQANGTGSETTETGSTKTSTNGSTAKKLTANTAKRKYKVGQF